MVQFYFLSVLLNAVSGAVLLGEGGENPLMPLFLERESPRLVLGLLTMITGLFKILSPLRDNLPVLGDLVPALAGFAAGFLLVFDFYRSRATLGGEKTERLALLAEKNRKFAGFAAIASAALHFFFPGVLFL